MWLYRVYILYFTAEPIFPYKMSFTKIRSNIAIWKYIAIYSNTIRNTALTRIVSPLFYVIAVFLNRIELLTCLRKHMSPMLLFPCRGIARLTLMVGYIFYNTTYLLLYLMACWFIRAFIYGWVF